MQTDRDSIFLSIAKTMSQCGTCDRLQVGAVIVVDNRVIATGYNGAPSKWDECDNVGHEMVAIGDRLSCVRTIHAEENAILQCALHGVSPRGGTLYCTRSTCYECLKRAAQVGITRIVYSAEYTGGRNAGLDIREIAARYSIKMVQLLDPNS